MLAIVTVALTAFSSPLRPVRHAPPEDAFSAVQQLLATVGSAVLISTVAVVPPSFAEQAPMTTPECKLECKKECNALAPGNEGYCGGQCDDFCDNLAPAASTSAGMGAQAEAAKDCSGYKTDKAKEYCEAQNVKALTPVKPGRDDLGIFGDSGVAYSKGVEDLFATAFGATRQNQNVKDADVGAFASDIGSAAVKAITGGK